ncbi:MAG: L-carnitine dehydrogenase [Rhodobiaceae bacterium]|nr:L-carnitine dehydrogenase [Rhodobiaceae bacterium]
MERPAKVAALGGGVIGGGWVARFMQNGVDVAVFDPAPNARAAVEAVIANAERVFPDLYPGVAAPRGAVHFAGSIAEAVSGADFIIESVPENLELKRALYADVEYSAAPDAIIASSTSGIRPSVLQEGLAHPERLVVTHPFNPVYLIPLVEIVAGDKTADVVVSRSTSIIESLGMKPLHVRKEIDAFIADRLLEALWREALWLINDGVATTAEIDDAIRYGFGLRWAQMGLFETYRIAGGERGMRHFLAQFGPCLQWPWSYLTDVPDMSDELVETIAAQSDAQSGAHGIRDLERIRDDNLVAILNALKGRQWGAGETVATHAARLRGAATEADSAERP